MKTIVYSLLALFALGACSGNADEDRHPDDFSEAVRALKSAALLDTADEKKFEALLDSSRRDTVNPVPALLKASGKMFVVDLATDGPGELYRKYKNLYEQVTAFFPALRGDSSGVAFTVIEDEESKRSDTLGCEIEIYSQGKRYFRSLGEGTLPYNKNFEDTAYTRLDPDFWKVFNTRLAAEKNPWRLFRIPFRYIFDRDEQTRPVYREDPVLFGLLLLSEEQYEKLYAVPALSLGNEFDLLSPAETEALLGKLLATGLCGAPDSSTKELMLESLQGNSLYSKLDLYDFCDSIFCTVSFDTLNDVDPYSTMLQVMSAVSKRNFEPFNVLEIPNEQDSSVYVEFRLGENKYNYTYRRRNGLLDLNAFENINIALAKENAPGRFYVVGNTDYSVVAACIDQQKLEQAKTAGLFDQLSEKVPDLMWRKYLRKENAQ